MIPTQNTWGTEALSWYSCWYSVTEAAMYFVLSRVGSGPWHRPNIRAVLWQGAVSSPSPRYQPRPSPHWPSINIQYAYRHGAASTVSRYEDDEWLHCPPRLSPRLSIRMTRGLTFPDWCHCPAAALHYCQEHCLKWPLIKWLSTERSK